VTDHIPFAAWVAFAGLLLTIIVTSSGIIWAVVWKLSDIRDTIKDTTDAKIKASNEDRDRKIHELRRDLTIKLTEINVDLDKQVDDVRKAAGEIGEALRSKITQLEFYVRDEFKLHVLKEDFRDDFRTITTIIDTLGSRIEKRLESFEEKLDALQKFNMQTTQRRESV